MDFDSEWNEGYQAFVEQGANAAFDCSKKSAAWNAGYSAARQNQEDDRAAAERQLYRGPLHIDC